MSLSAMCLVLSLLACGPKTPPAPPAPVKVDSPQVTCLDGSEQVGRPPPEGLKLWCRHRQANGQWQDHGDLMEWYASGAKKIAGTVLNGKKEGAWSTWYEDGQLQVTQHYVSGRAEGAYVDWWENGKKKAEGQKVKGDEDGHWEYWHDNGVIFKRGAWQDSAPEGRWLEYDRDGKPIEIRQYAFGRLLSHTVITDTVH